MGEQRPGDALKGFIGAGLPPEGPGMGPFYYSRPDTVTDSFEARRFLAPRTGDRPQTEFFEYHWAHLMHGNRLDDLWPTFRRMLLLSPWRVPSGLKVVWFLAWAVIVFGAWAVARGPLSGIALTDDRWWDVALRALFGGGLLAAIVSYLFARVLGRGVTKSFVDVVRYLDTSPRSYEVRREIRKGLVHLLTGLHDKTLFGKPRYQRIIVVAHSLGAYIAYDAIAYLWGEMNHERGKNTPSLDGLLETEEAASRLPEPRVCTGGQPPPAELAAYQRAQRRLWLGLAEQGNRWLVTDLVTVGTPMYFADRLYTGDLTGFKERVRRGELPTCPPITDPVRADPPDPETSPDRAIVAEADVVPTTIPRFTWRWNRRVLHESAPFAVVRWTNMWFPHRRGFGDWFGGPLGRLYGPGIRDIEVIGNTTGRWGWFSGRRVPALAHIRYFRFPNDPADESVTTLIRKAIDLELDSFHHTGPLSHSVDASVSPNRIKQQA